jgi:hypothetical protein
MKLIEQDGAELCTWHYEDGTIYRRHISLNEQAILDENARIRGNGGPKTLSFGKPLLQIPYAVWLDLRKKFPALASKDKAEKRSAWIKLSQDPEYRSLWLED